MSKELEALYKISQIEFETGDYMNDDGYMMTIVGTEMYAILLKALTPPTEEEVCKEIEKFMGGEVIYENKEFIWGTRTRHSLKEVVASTHEYVKGKHNYQIEHPLPPHLITMIGRFYEGERK